MFLKAYSGLSDRKLFEYPNGSIQYQMFCGIFLGPNKLIDFKLISKIRTELARKLNIRMTQDILAKAWKPYIEHPHVVLEDATCYESYMRFPTNVKLLFESAEWMYGQMKQTCKYLKIPLPDKVSGAERKVLCLYADAEEALESDRQANPELIVSIE